MGLHSIDAETTEAFKRREGAAVERVRRLVSVVVASRGYFVPACERADLVQQVLLDLWAAVLVDEGGKIRSFEAVIRTVAYRRCVDWLRLRERESQAVLETDAREEPDPDSAYLAEERLRMGLRVLSELKAPCRELVRLVFEEQLSYRQISERLHRSEGAVRVQMCGCLKSAREMLRRIGARG